MGILLLQVTGIVPFIVLFGAVLFVIFLLGSAVRIVNEYERGLSSG